MQPKAQGDNPMKYEKPEISQPIPAASAIQNPSAKPGILTFDSATHRQNDMGTVNAYEADE
jgi:hypothetical protein